MNIEFDNIFDFSICDNDDTSDYAKASDLTSHTDNTSNPHKVTATQVEADPLGSASSALTSAKAYTDDAVADMIRRADSGEFDGYTPVKGKDYFTTAEIQQIQNEVSSGAIGEFKTVVDTEIDRFNTNAIEQVNTYNQNDSEKTTSYNANATEKLNAYNSNTQSKVTEYNQNAANKTAEYNSNAETKLNEYNTNANNRVAEFDSHTEQIQSDVNKLKSDLGECASQLNSIWLRTTIHEETGKYLNMFGKFVDSATSCKYTDKIRCKAGDTFAYKGKGAYATASWIFYNGSTLVSAGQSVALDVPTTVTIPSGVTHVVFASFIDGNDVNRVTLEITPPTLNEKEKKTIRDNIEAVAMEDLETHFIKKQYDDSINLFDNTNYVKDEYLNSSGVVQATGYAHTGLIKLEAGSYVTNCYVGNYGSNAMIIHICTSEGVQIGSIRATVIRDDGNNSLMTFTLSEDSYIKFNVRLLNVETTMLVVGSTEEDFPSSYIPYKHDLIVEEGVHLNSTMKEEVVNIAETNPLYGKKLSVNGDSICQGAGFSGGYAKIIGENNNMIVQNIGVGGGTITAETYSDSGARHWISRTISNMDTDSDYIILEGGVNDSVSDKIGAITTGYTETLDDTTFYGAVESMFKQLVKRFAGKKYGFLIVHQMSTSMRPNGVRYNAIMECASKWGVPVLDLSKEIPPFALFSSDDSELYALRNTYTKLDSNGIGDGWHPNEECYKKYYVPKIEAWLKTL